MVKHINIQFNIFHVAQSDRFARLKTKLSKTLKSDMGKSVTSLVKFGMKDVKDDLNSQAKSLGKFCLDIQSMQTQLNDIQSLLESVVIIDDTAEGQKNKKAKDANPAVAQGEQQSSEPLSGEGKELIVHNSEKKKSEGIISVEDDLDEDDKQPLSKRFKIMTYIPDIPNPTPLNTFVLDHLLKSKEQQKSIQEFTDQLFKNTSSRFSPTPPKEPTPPRDSSKGKAITIMEEPGNELVINHAKRVGLPPPPELATFGLTAEEKKRKRTELIKEVFLTEDVRVDGIERNLIPPPGVMPIQGLAINEPESGIFFMNGNTDIGFQRKSEFHLTPTIELITSETNQNGL
ncbi:hypothetical protein Tco_0715028 [Tanacetum coccineum]